jgi:large subunit ribosomal protein L23
MNPAQIITKPIITEKSMQDTANNCYCFKVDKKSTKREIKKAIEEIYNVKVINVRTRIVKGKTRKTGRLRKSVKLDNWKKAYIQLTPGQKIEIFEEGGK